VQFGELGRELVQRHEVQFTETGTLARHVRGMETKLSGLSKDVKDRSEATSKDMSTLIGLVTGNPIVDVTPEQLLRDRAAYRIIDVRRQDEWVGDCGHLEDATQHTLGLNLERALERLDPDASYIFICRSGGRSSRAARLTQERGFKKIFNLSGGCCAGRLLDFRQSGEADLPHAKRQGRSPARGAHHGGGARAYWAMLAV